MAHTDIPLALAEYKEKYWVSLYGEDFMLSGNLKKDNYQKVTIEAKYEDKGVVVRQWWEHKGHHQKTLNRYLFRHGKVYRLPHMTAIGFYTEKNN